MHDLLHVLEHAVIHTLTDTLKILPFLFLTYLLMEFLEHKAGGAPERWLRGSGKVGPLLGGLLGMLPQCGFSTMASGLYAGRIITAGTLVAVFLATSDEMLPVLLSRAVPVPFILLFLNKILAWMEGTKTFAGVARWLKERAHKKSDTYYKYEMLGLFILVAIPLPGTGAWTGTLAASFLNMGIRSTAASVSLGVIIAGIIMGVASTGVFSIFGI